MTNHSIVMLRRQQASKTFVCVYKILRFCANPQKFQIILLVPAKNKQLLRLPSTQDVAGSNPARGSSFFLLRKKELSSDVVVYFALSLRMSLHIRASFNVTPLAKGRTSSG